MRWIALDLQDLLDTMQILDDKFEDEAYQPSDKIDELKAVLFAERSGLYLAMYRVIWRDLSRIVKEMNEEVDSIYEERRSGGDLHEG